MPGSRPTSRIHTLQNPLARMLPIQREQLMVYRMGERVPPSGGMENHGPSWEAITLGLGAFGTDTQTLQARVNLQRDFTLLSVAAQSPSNAAGGFRLQLMDAKKMLRFFDRPMNFSNFAGPMGGGANGAAFFLREPYCFDLPDSQVLVEATNFEAIANTIQIVLYGQVLRFNEVVPGKPEFPGGNVPSWGSV